MWNLLFISLQHKMSTGSVTSTRITTQAGLTTNPALTTNPGLTTAWDQFRPRVYAPPNQTGFYFPCSISYSFVLRTNRWRSCWRNICCNANRGD